tara:strand:- start:205 stop:456 length:252 start_codon:yes stop_codon:yes gene_type:complete
MAYRWEITKDFIDFNLTGIQGPGINYGEEKITENKATFRLIDDDGEVYCKGFIYGDYQGFEPLDDYGMPALGCTMVSINGEIL